MNIIVSIQARLSDFLLLIDVELSNIEGKPCCIFYSTSNQWVMFGCTLICHGGTLIGVSQIPWL